MDSRNYAIKEAGFVLLQIDGAEYSGELTNSTEGAIVRGYNIDAYNYNLVKTFSVPNTSYWVVRPYYIVYDKATGEALAAQYGEQEIFDLLTDAD